MRIETSLFLAYLSFATLVGIIGGSLIGIYVGQYMLWDGMSIVLSGSNVELNIDINETEIVDRTYEKMEPIINTISDKNCTWDTTGRRC